MAICFDDVYRDIAIIGQESGKSTKRYMCFKDGKKRGFVSSYHFFQLSSSFTVMSPFYVPREDGCVKKSFY